MIVVPLAQYLSEFEEGEVEPFDPQDASPARYPQPVFEHLTLVRDEAAGMKGTENRAVSATVAAPAEPIVDHAEALREAVAAAREAAFEEGRAAMKAELEAAHVQAMRSERESAVKARLAALEAARAEWVAAESENLSAKFDARLDRMEAAIRASLTSVLRPLASNARQRQTLTQLAEAVRAMTLDGKAFTILATGPGDLLSAFSEKLGPRRDLVTFEIDESVGEVRIEADRTVIETRLSSWRAALEEALA